MFLLRVAKPHDLSSLYQLTLSAGTGLTTLPKNKGYLKEKIQHSYASLEKKVKSPKDESYFFVLEYQKKIVGCSALIASVGYQRPFFSYLLKEEARKAKVLGIEKKHLLLKLKKRYQGPSEVCSLFLHPKLRQAGVGRLLSLGRFLFMKNFPKRFQKSVLAEMRGYSDEKLCSPFWEYIGRQFFDMDFQKADTLSTFEPDLIQSLIPKEAIYLGLLPKKMLRYIAKPHPNTLPALRLLCQEGFAFDHEVDIFDAGPQISCKLSSIRTFRQARLYELDKTSNLQGNCLEVIISNHCNDPKLFKATFAKVKIQGNRVAITPETKKLLKLRYGEKVYLSFPKPSKKDMQWKQAYSLMVSGKWAKVRS